MAIYFVCAFLVIIAAYLAQKTGENRVIKSIFIFAVFTIMVLLPGLRDSSVGTDTNSYAYYFELNRIPITDMLNWDALTEEPGYFLITIIARFVSDQYWALLVVIAIVAVLCHMISIYKFSLNPVFSLFVFITLGYYTFFFNGARQGIACAIYTLSFGALLKGNFWKYAIWVLIASLFHKTAIIALPLYFLFRMKFSLKLLLMMAGIAILGVLAFDSILQLGIYISVRYAIYEKLHATGAQLLTIFYVALCLFFLIFRSFVSSEDRNSYDTFLNMFMLGSLVYVIIMFSEGYVELTRIAVYFHIASIFLWPIIFRNIRSFISKLFLGAGLVSGHLAYYYIFLDKMANLTPYRFNIDVLQWF